MGKWIPWDESWYAAGMLRASGPLSGVPGLFQGGRRDPRSQCKVRANGLPVFFQVLPYLGSHEDLSWSPLEWVPSLFTIFQTVPKVAGPLAGSRPDLHPPNQPFSVHVLSPRRALVRVLSDTSRPVQSRFSCRWPRDPFYPSCM